MAGSNFLPLDGTSAHVEQSKPRTISRTCLAIFEAHTPRRPYLTFTLGPGHLQRLVIKVWSNDLIWYNESLKSPGACANAYTWFALGLLTETPLEKPFNGDLFEFQRNVASLSTSIQCHTHEWSIGVPAGEDECDKAVNGWIESLGCTKDAEIGIFPLARQKGWMNTVWKMEIHVFSEPKAESPDSGLQCDQQLNEGQGTEVARQSHYSNIRRQLKQDKSIELARQATNTPQGRKPKWISIITSPEEAAIIASQSNFATNQRLCVAEKLYGFAYWLMSMNDLSGHLDGLQEAIELARASVDLTPTDHPNLPERLLIIQDILLRTYELTRQTTDLEESIEAARKALELTSSGHPSYPRLLSQVAVPIMVRARHFDQIADLNEAVGLARQSVALLPLNDVSLADSLVTFGGTLHDRFHRRGQMVDLEEATDAVRQAIYLTRNGDPRMPDRLDSLAEILLHQYECKDEMHYLEEAVKLSRRAVALTPHHDSAKAKRLSSLGKILGQRYDRLGRVEDCDEAIKFLRHVVELSAHDHPDYAERLCKLGIRLGSRYERSGQLADLNESLALLRKAVKSAPQRPSTLNNLGIELAALSDRTEQQAHIEEAIGLSKQAVALTPHDDASLPRMLSSLGNHFKKLFDYTGQLTDLNEAIALMKRTVDLTSQGHRFQLLFLINLGMQLGRRYALAGQEADIEEATKLLRCAVDMTSDDDPNRTRCLCNLGSVLHIRYKKTANVSNLEEASSVFRDAWEIETAFPFERIRAAGSSLWLLLLAGRYEEAIELGKRVIDFLPSVNTKLLNRIDQQFVLSTFSNVAVDLCAALLQSNQAADALYYLEKGRAVIIGQLLDSRSDLSSLTDRFPDIGRRYKLLRDEVNSFSRASELHAVEAQVLRRRREALAELDACTKDIRDLPGHEHFLLGQKVAEMQECAQGGTVVVVNVSELRSDAILVSSETVKVVNLSQLTFSDAEHWMKKKWIGRRSELAKRNKEFLEFLSWLWKVCVREILKETCSGRDETTALPRVWWIGTGLGSSMPFHAAGIHRPGSTENTLSRVISSYTPSIKALAHSQTQTRARKSILGSLVIAAMPTTPGAGKLVGVGDEKKGVRETAEGHLPVDLFEMPTAEQVVEALKDCSIAHLACHGSTDHQDPSSSGLILRKFVEGEEKQDWLTVHTVSELNLAKARIAYLSACSTAENKAGNLRDEVIHVVSGFQVAGFPHVVGCLWPSDDTTCVKVAKNFYSRLLENGTAHWDDWTVASALREAVLAAKEEDPRMPLFWAPFVLYGA